MNAKEAREISEKNKRTISAQYVNHIDNRIGNAARKGKSSIHNPQIGLIKQLIDDELEAVRTYYITLGYTWLEHLCNPSSDNYVTLEW